jgi:hypothetical protein
LNDVFGGVDLFCEGFWVGCWVDSGLSVCVVVAAEVFGGWFSV